MSADIFPFDPHEVVSTSRSRRSLAIAELLNRQSRLVECASEAENAAWTAGWLECLEFLGKLDPMKIAEIEQLCFEKRQQVNANPIQSLSANKNSPDGLRAGDKNLERSSAFEDEGKSGATTGRQRHPKKNEPSDREGEKPTNTALDRGLNSIASAIHESLNESEVSQRLVEQLCRGLNADCAGAILYDLKAQSVTIVAAYSSQSSDRPGREEAPLGLTLKLDSTEEWNALVSQQRPWVVQDVETATMPEVERLLLLCAGLHATLMVPISDGDRPIGIAYVSQKRSCRLWEETEMELAEMVVQQAAIALVNTRRYQKAIESAEREQVVNRIAGRIRNSLNLDTTIETALGELLTLTSADMMLFSVPTSISGALNHLCKSLRIAYRVDCERRSGDRSEHPLEIGMQVDLSQFGSGLIQMLLSQEVSAIGNTQTAPFCERERATFQQLQIGSLLSVPIWYREKLLGHVWAIKPQSYEWREEEIAAMESVSLHLAIAIAQAQLYQHTQQQATEARSQAQQLQKALDEKTQLIASLHATQAQLVQSEKMSSLGQLVAGVAHEINNPINFIYGNLPHIANYTSDIMALMDLYRQHFPHPPQAIVDFTSEIDFKFIKKDLDKILHSMRAGSERVRQIVLTLRNFSRLDEADLKFVDLHQGLDSTAILLEHRLHDIEVVKDYGKIPRISCYSGQLNQVFMNLFANAIDAIERKTRGHNREASLVEQGNCDRRIEIRTQTVEKQAPIQVAAVNSVPVTSSPARGEWIQIRIRDTGCGIAPEHQNKVFDPFFTTKPVGGGTGLGLSIAYKIVVEKHQGRLWFENHPEGGCEFILELPLHPFN